MKKSVLIFCLVMLTMGCGSDGGGGGGGSTPPPPPPDPPVMPTDGSVTIVNCLTWPVSKGYADVRVRVNWTDQADNEEWYEVDVGGDGFVYTALPVILDPDAYKTHIDVLLSDVNKVSTFSVRACHVDACSEWLDAGSVLFQWDAFDYCEAHPP